MMDRQIAFLNDEDFVAELAEGSPKGSVVRVEALVQGSVGHPARAVFQIVAAAHLETVRQWAICRIRLGSDLALFADHPHYQRLRENTATAKALIASDLARRGYMVRGGMPANITQCETSAYCDLWRIEKDANGFPLLVANEPVQGEEARHEPIAT